MPRGDTNPRGMPPSRNTVWVRPEVSEQTFEDNWTKAFGQSGPNKKFKSKFEKPHGETRHRIKMVNDMGEWK